MRRGCGEFFQRLLIISTIVLALACGGGGRGGGGIQTGFSISGTITSAVNGAPVPNVTITLSGSATAGSSSDSNGNFTFSGLGNGSYTVEPTLTNAAFSPAILGVIINGRSMTGKNFAATRAAILASGIQFLPATNVSTNQLHASLITRGGYAYFTDSSDFPLKKVPSTGGGSTTLAARFPDATNVVLYGSNAYWTDGTSLNKTSVTSGQTTILAVGTHDHGIGGSPITADIVVDDTYVFWANSVIDTNCTSCNFVIQKVPVGGGTAITVATATRPVVALKGNATTIYWEESFSEPVTAGCLCGSSIKAVPKVGGSVTILVDNRLNGTMPPPPTGHIPGTWRPTGGLAITPTAVVFGSSGTSSYQVIAVPITGGNLSLLATVDSPATMGAILSLSTSGANAYWLDPGNQALETVPLTGGSADMLAIVAGNPNTGANRASLVLDATNAYWTEQTATGGCCLQVGAGSVKQVPLAGGSITTLVTGLDSPGALAVDAANLVWAEPWRLGRAALDGSSVKTLASGISSGMSPIAVDSSNVYVLDGDYIKKVPLAGGTMEKVTSAHSGTIGDLSVVNQDIATDGVNIYWTTEGTGTGYGPTIQKVSVLGGPTVTLASDSAYSDPQGSRWRILVDTQNVYWSTSGAVKSVPISGGTITTLVVDPQFVDFTIDASNVYFSLLGKNVINKVPLGGGTISAVQQLAEPWVLINDASHLYWIDLLSNGIMETTKTTVPGTLATSLPGTLWFDPLIAFEGLSIDSGGLYVTETQTGNIYRLY